MTRMICDGWWEQVGFGRQPMNQLVIEFQNGELFGEGNDIVGAFTLRGQLIAECLTLHKQYIGKHAIAYVGTSEGEGTYSGNWNISGYVGGKWSIRFRTLPQKGTSDDLANVPRLGPP